MDRTFEIQEQLRQAVESCQPLSIVAGGSKNFLGRPVAAETFSLAGHSGIVDYDFRELVVTVRAATPLQELQQELAAQGQYLPFEPPLLSSASTIGGTLAAGLSGPARPYRGSARDYVLGTHVLNGKAQHLTFGGQVMKNVAGYDLSRLMVGAMGTLGIILQCSLKVLPRPQASTSLMLEMPMAEAVTLMNQWAGQQHPLSAACYVDGILRIRLSGFAASIEKSVSAIGGEVMTDTDSFWQDLNEQRLGFFQNAKTLWRLSVPSTTGNINLPGRCLIDWGGAQRWLVPDETVTAEAVFEQAAAVGGHATCFRYQYLQDEVFQPLSPAKLALHKRLRQSLDPLGIFNPGKLYADL